MAAIGDRDAVDDPGLDKRPVNVETPPWQRGRYGTSIGRAVHGVLQFCDLATGSDIDNLARSQCAAEGVIGLEDRVASLARSTLDTPIVRQVVDGAEHWRELFVAAPVGDRVLEGYVDLLVRTADGLVIVDYKTDQWSGPVQTAERVGRYRLQLAAYGAALGAALGEPIVGGILVRCVADGSAEQIAITGWADAIAEVRARRGLIRVISERRSSEVAEEPVSGVPGGGLERARLLEEMRGARHHHQLTLAAQLPSRQLVQLQHLVVAPTDDQQRRGSHRAETRAGQVGSPAARHHGSDLRPGVGSCVQGGGGTRARTEEADRELAEVGLADDRTGDLHEPTSEQFDVEHVGAVSLLGGGEQVEQQGGQPRPVEDRRDVAVAGTVTAAPAAVREDHDARGVGRHREMPAEHGTADIDAHLLVTGSGTTRGGVGSVQTLR